jgi:hypothetical protein
VELKARRDRTRLIVATGIALVTVLGAAVEYLLFIVTIGIGLVLIGALLPF